MAARASSCLGWPLAALCLLAGVAGCGPRAEEEPAWLATARLQQPLAALEAYRTAPPGDALAARLETARLLLRYRKVGWGLHLVRQLAEDQPEEVEVWRLRMELALLNAFEEEARDSALRVVEGKAGDANTFRRLGELGGGSDDQRPVDWFARSVALDDGDAKTWYAYARALAKAGRPQAALEAYEHHARLLGRPGSAGLERARLLIHHLDRPREGQDLLELLEAEGQLPTAGDYLLGSLLLEQGEQKQGRAILERYRRRMRRDELAEHGLVRRQQKLDAVLGELRDGRAAEALELLRELRESFGGAPHLDQLEAAAASLSGRLARAAELASSASQSRPRRWRYRYLAALHLDRLGLSEEALREVRATLAIQPLALEAHYLHRRLLRLGGAPATARQRAGAAIRTLESVAPPAERQDPTLDGALPIEVLWDLVRHEEAPNRT